MKLKVIYSYTKIVLETKHSTILSIKIKKIKCKTQIKSKKEVSVNSLSYVIKIYNKP